MNAYIYNRVESELLKVVNEVSKILEIDITVEVHALEEGGIRSIYKFLSNKNNRKHLLVASAYFAGIISTVMSNVISEQIKSDPEMEALKKQKIELEIKKLKQELNDDFQVEDDQEKEHEVEISEEFKDSLAIYISELNQVKLSKSKFYKFLLEEGKIEKVSTQVLDENFIPISKEKIVPRKDFNLFIVKEIEIDSDYQNDIELEVVSPVLKKNKMSWKAIFNGEPITFSLKDENFRNMVTAKNLQFYNGTKIVCDLETKQKMNDVGEILKGGRSVYNVTKIIYPDGVEIDI